MECATCGDVLPEGRPKYCSRSCNNRDSSRRARERLSRERKTTPKMPKACKRCGEPTPIGHYGHYKNYCSDACRRRQCVETFRFRTYGVTAIQYNAQAKYQQHVCGICQKSCAVHKQLSVDHDHRTGAWRGLLCHRCNRLLGMADDSAARLAKAAVYLEHGGCWNG